MRFGLASLILGLVVVAAAVPASGFWSFGGGSGSGVGSSGVPLPVTVSVAATTQPLFPIGTAIGDVSLTLTNPNAFAVHVPLLALDTTQGTAGFSVDAAHSGCDLTTLSYTTQSNAGAGWNVLASSSLAVDLTNAVALAVGAPDACQGASFTVYLTAL